MQKRRKLQNTLVGVFVLGVLASLTAALLLERLHSNLPFDQYTVRAVIDDPSGVPTNLSSAWIDLPGEKKQIDGGFEFSVPAQVNFTKMLTVTAEVKEEGWRGSSSSIRLDRSSLVIVKVQLKSGGAPLIRGIVVTNLQKAVSGARVSLLGFGSESTITDAAGSFGIPPHTDRDGPIHLHAEKAPDLVVDGTFQVSDAPFVLRLQAHSMSSSQQSVQSFVSHGTGQPRNAEAPRTVVEFRVVKSSIWRNGSWTVDGLPSYPQSSTSLLTFQVTPGVHKFHGVAEDRVCDFTADVKSNTAPTEPICQ